MLTRAENWLLILFHRVPFWLPWIVHVAGCSAICRVHESQSSGWKPDSLALMVPDAPLRGGLLSAVPPFGGTDRSFLPVLKQLQLPGAPAVKPALLIASSHREMR
jgi:hypothetical protein